MDIKGYFRRVKNFSKNRWENNKNSIIINYVIFIIIVLITTLSDLLMKEFMFQGKFVNGRLEGNGEIIFSNSFVTFKSIMHYGLTFIPGNIFNYLWLIHLFSFLIMVISIIICFYSKSFLLIFWAGFTFGGTFGNLFDRLVFGGGVRDLISLTFFPNDSFFAGVFNLADVYVSVGSAIGVIFVLKILYKEIINKK